MRLTTTIVLSMIGFFLVREDGQTPPLFLSSQAGVGNPGGPFPWGTPPACPTQRRTEGGTSHGERSHGPRTAGQLPPARRARGAQDGQPRVVAGAEGGRQLALPPRR